MAAVPEDYPIVKGLVEHSPYAITLIDGLGEIRWANTTVERIFGYTADEVTGTNIFGYLDLDWDPTALESVGAALDAEGLRLPTLFRAIRKNGTKVIVEVWANSQLRDPDLQGLVAYIRFWDERVLLDEALESLAGTDTAATTMRLLLDAMACETLEASGSILFDPARGHFRSGVATAGLDPVLTGIDDDRRSADGTGAIDATASRLDDDTAVTPWALVLATGDRQAVAVDDLAEPYREHARAAGFDLCWAWPVAHEQEGVIAGCVVAWRRGDEVAPDQSRVMAMNRMARIAELALDRDRTLNRLTYAAGHDALTGLANRARFYETLDLLATGPTHGHSSSGATGTRSDSSGRIGLLYLDLDGFKPVNDRFGHSAGDAVLVEVARRLSRAVRKQDLLARLGGDEFAIVCPDTASVAELEALASRVVVAVGEPMTVAEASVSIGISIGISIGAPDSSGSAGLVEAADAALYRIKAMGKGGWLVAPS